MREVDTLCDIEPIPRGNEFCHARGGEVVLIALHLVRSINDFCTEGGSKIAQFCDQTLYDRLCKGGKILLKCLRTSFMVGPLARVCSRLSRSDTSKRFYSHNCGELERTKFFPLGAISARQQWRMGFTAACS